MDAIRKDNVRTIELKLFVRLRVKLLGQRRACSPVITVQFGGGKSMGGRHERMETTKCQHTCRRRRRYQQFPSSSFHASLPAAVILSKLKSLDRIGRRKLTSQYVFAKTESGMRGRGSNLNN